MSRFSRRRFLGGLLGGLAAWWGGGQVTRTATAPVAAPISLPATLTYSTYLGGSAGKVTTMVYDATAGALGSGATSQWYESGRLTTVESLGSCDGKSMRSMIPPDAKPSNAPNQDDGKPAWPRRGPGQGFCGA